ncbi:Nodulation protein G [Marine Group I thaumarchaeote SCGC AAA799-B03]|uniref:Nodulation protein G n=1 Tax=Marine Group I thaumarchaeote SCGC AAA799-B03 TaxID=1502289 RepID=A0A087S6L8_9ARCH|nr:Nodulation protein G [Marine Group I thaumarchaeote SCGC AAA799-B03]
MGTNKFLKKESKHMTKPKIIITGSEGLIGKELNNYLSTNNEIICLDIELGHDLTNETFVKNWFKENNANYLINCFAINDHVAKNQKRGTLFDISLESFSKILNVNLVALFSVCREFARNNKNGAIVNFSASTGIVSARPDLYDGAHKHAAYSISKAGVINLTKFLATHLAPNIRVNCVAPGGVEHDQDDEFKKKYSKLTPLNRMMKKNELNGIIEYLCTEKSSYTTGSTFVIDGGWTTW